MQTESPVAPSLSLDYRLLFESAPGLYLVLTPDFTIVAASEAYLRATMTQRADVIGRSIFDVFPDNPDDPNATGVANLKDSLDRVVKQRTADAMAVQRYDIRRPESEGGGFDERYWSPINCPVLGPDHETAYIIHQVEDVTEFVHLKQRGIEQEQLAQKLLTRGAQMEADIFRRAQEIQEGNQRLRHTNEELIRLHGELEHRVQQRTEELAQANDALKAEVLERSRNEALLQSILNNTFDAIISISDLGIVETFNEAAERIFGYTQAEVVGQNVSMLMPDPYRSKHDGYLDSYLRTGVAKIIGVGREVLGRRKDGSVFPIDLSVTECKQQTAECRRFIGVVRDITERKQAEEHHARLVEVLEATPDFVGLADANRRPIFINRAGRMMLGMAADEDISATQLDNYHADWSLKVNEEEGIPTAIEHGTWMGEAALLTRGGQELPVSQVIVAHKTPEGEVRFLSTIMRDLSERIRLEQQLHQAQKMEAFGQLSGGVSHDFNNLLTVITGYCECLEDDATLTDDSREMVQEIYRAGDRAASLTRQLLAFSRQQVFQAKVLNLNEIVTETGKMLGRLIGEDVAFATALLPTLWPVRVDAGQMEQVLMNLAVNARDAMPQGGRLTIETANVELDESYSEDYLDVTPGRYVVMAVSDTGCGMDQKTIARIFEPFFTTKEAGKGTGLGLATVFGIVKQSGGHITVYSEPERGTTFRIYLPRVESNCEPHGEERPKHSPARGTETILVVEDAEMVRNLACRILRSHGYAVLEADNGAKALLICEQHAGPIDLVLTDVVMPEMSGRQLSEHLRERQLIPKVLFMSGYTDDAVVRHGILEAEASFIQKPFTPASLAQKVRDVLDS